MDLALYHERKRKRLPEIEKPVRKPPKPPISLYLLNI
jgi:hypothetical protein